MHVVWQVHRCLSPLHDEGTVLQDLTSGFASKNTVFMGQGRFTEVASFEAVSLFVLFFLGRCCFFSLGEGGGIRQADRMLEQGFADDALGSGLSRSREVCVSASNHVLGGSSHPLRFAVFKGLVGVTMCSSGSEDSFLAASWMDLWALTFWLKLLNMFCRGVNSDRDWMKF